ncbi:MAG: hypothetical protein AAGF20_00140 [Pseudomonadota bacterium]
MPLTGSFSSAGQSNWFRAGVDTFSYELEFSSTGTVSIERSLGGTSNPVVVKQVTDASDDDLKSGNLEPGSRKAFFRFNCSAVSGTIDYKMQL